MVAVLLYTIDTTIANVALPHMQGSLQASQEQILWVLTSYVVASAVMTPLSGFLAVRFGERRVLLASVLGFVATSVLCGLATSLEQVVAFRALQGICGAALIPLSQTVVLLAFPRERHAAALGVWGVGVMIGPVIGPALGGYLTEYFNWRYVFFVNLPVGALAFFGLAATMPRRATSLERPFDLKGFVMLGGAIALGQLALDRGNQLDWFHSTQIIALLLVSGLLLYMFVVHMLTAARPFLERAMFHDRNFVLGGLFGMFVYPLIIIPNILLPLFMQQLQGVPSLAAGFAVAPRGLGLALGMLLTGRLARWFSSGWLALAGMIGLIAAMLPMSELSLDTSATSIALTLTMQGVALGIAFGAVNFVTYATLPPQYRTEASAFTTLLRYIAGAIAISSTGAWLNHLQAANRTRLGEAINPWTYGSFLQGMQYQSPEFVRSMVDLELSRQAAVVAYGNAFMGLMLTAAACLVIAYALTRQRAS